MVIPAEIINEILGLDAKNPLTIGDLYSDDDETKREAEKSLFEIKSFLRDSGFDDNESEIIIYKLQRYNAPPVKDQEHSEQNDMKQIATKGGLILVISTVATILLWLLNKYLYNEKHLIWYFGALVNVIAVIGIIIGLLFLFTAFSGGMANSLSALTEKISKIFRIKKKKKQSEENGYLDYAKYLMEEHHYSKENVRFFFSDYGMDYEEMKAMLDSL